MDSSWQHRANVPVSALCSNKAPGGILTCEIASNPAEGDHHFEAWEFIQSREKVNCSFAKGLSSVERSFSKSEGVTFESSQPLRIHLSWVFLMLFGS